MWRSTGYNVVREFVLLRWITSDLTCDKYTCRWKRGSV